MNDDEKITKFLEYLKTLELYFNDGRDIFAIDIWTYREKDDSVIFCRKKRGFKK